MTSQGSICAVWPPHMDTMLLWAILLRMLSIGDIDICAIVFMSIVHTFSRHGKHVTRRSMLDQASACVTILHHVDVHHGDVIMFQG